MYLTDHVNITQQDISYLAVLKCLSLDLGKYAKWAGFDLGFNSVATAVAYTSSFWECVASIEVLSTSLLMNSPRS